MFPMVYEENSRKIITAASILFLMFVNRLFVGPSPKILLNIVIWITYSGILFIPKSWWTRKKFVITVLVVIVETAAGMYWFHEIKLIYFLAIILFTVSIRLSMSKSPIPVVLALLVTAMFYIRFGSGNFFNTISFLFLSIALYFAIRTRMQRNEMYELNKQQLVKLQEAYEQLQEASIKSMQYAVLEERTRIARDIHDSVGHSLTSLIVQMQALKYMMKKDPEDAEKSLDGMLAVARQGLQDIRTSVHSLAENQVISGTAPLKALLSRMEASTSIHYEFHSDLNTEELNIQINGILFRVLQEAITNIIRHSKATFVNISLKKETGKILMRIRDNGTVTPNQKINEGFGLKGMKSRVEEKGGKLNYSSLEPNGFEIKAEIPLNQYDH